MYIGTTEVGGKLSELSWICPFWVYLRLFAGKRPCQNSGYRWQAPAPQPLETEPYNDLTLMALIKIAAVIEAAAIEQRKALQSHKAISVSRGDGSPQRGGFYLASKARN